MTRAFTQSPLKAFTESPLHARGTGKTLPFIFQSLQSARARHHTDGTPWGFRGHPGESQSDDFQDPRDATFLPQAIPPAGATFEIWQDVRSSPPDAVLQRISSRTPTNARRSGNGWLMDFGLGPPHQYDILMASKAGVNVIAGTDPVYGDHFDPNVWEDNIGRLKIFPPAAGVATFHILPLTMADMDPLEFIKPLNGIVTFPEPYLVQERNAGDPAQIYEPVGPTYAELDIWSTFTNFQSDGTRTVVLFWFGLTAATLPIFPNTLNVDAL